MSDEPQSHYEWAEAIKPYEIPPLSEQHLQWMYEATCRYGSGNCWTGTTGTLAAMVKRLLEERLRVLAEHERTKVSRENNN